MEFSPQDHLMDIRGRQYLEVKWRLVWLRHAHPDWAITTELLAGGDPVIFRAAIADAEGRVIATGHAEYPRGRPYPSVMKCETAAIGRALAHCGFGTQFSGEDGEEAELVDAPVYRNGRGAGRAPLPQGPAGARPAAGGVSRAGGAAPGPGSAGPAGRR